MVLVEDTKKWLDSVYILKVVLVRFVDGLDLRCKRKNAFKDDLMIDLNEQKDDIAIYWYSKDDRKSMSGLWVWSVGHFGPDKFDMFTRLPCGEVGRK